jgi:hypothetical protein
MSGKRRLLAVSTVVAVGVVALASSATHAGQSPSAARESTDAATASRTSWGDPDLQGTWTSEAELGVPFERPRDLGDRLELTDEEFAERRAQVNQQLDTDNADFDLETADRSNAGQVGSATSPPPHWLERGAPSRRTSLVIAPANGRVPEMTAEGRQRARVVRGSFTAAGTVNNAAFDGPEDLSSWDRCITRGLPSAIFPTVYNANMRIVQAPGSVAITYEMIHDTRVIPTDGRSRVSPALRGYFGDSRGRWEGDTLVVEATNFSEKSSYRGSHETLRLVERFTRVGGALRYEVTVEDPSTWEGPWTAALNLTPQGDGLFEYACHEGNYAMRNILSAARASDTASR